MGEDGVFCKMVGEKMVEKWCVCVRVCVSRWFVSRRACVASAMYGAHVHVFEKMNANREL